MNALQLLSFSVSAALLAGCVDTRQKTVERGTLSIKVVPPPGKGVPVHVSVYQPKDGKRGPEIQIHDAGSDGLANFGLPMGQYDVRAFADLNHTGKPGPNEPAGELRGVEPDPDLHSEKPPLVLTLAMPAPGSVPAEAPVVDKKKAKGTGRDASPAPTHAPALGAPAKSQNAAGPGLPLPSPPKP
jgi:hypothetical protein